MKNIKWTRSECIRVGKLCKDLKDFRDRFPSARTIARQRGWDIARLCNLARRKQPNGFWTYERIRKVACKFKRLKDFRLQEGSAYNALRVMGRIEELVKELDLKVSKHSKNYWSKKECRSRAKKYKNKKEFRDRDSNAYAAAYKNGWLDKICDHMEELGNYTKRFLYAFEFADKSVYVGLTYNFERRYRSHQEGNTSISKKLKKVKYKTNRFGQKSYPAAKAAKKEQYLIDNYRRKGWTILNKNKAGSLGGNIKKWTDELLIKEAKKYQTRKELRENNESVYSLIHQRKLGKVCFKHMKKLSCRHTDEELIEITKSYSSMKELCKNHPNIYNKILRRPGLRNKCIFTK